MNDEPVGICVLAKVLLKALKIACAGVIHVQILMGEQVDCHRWFIHRAKQIQQDEEPSVMHANLGHCSPHVGAALLLGQEDNGLRRSR